jgi:SAM-dependent methyltransferase
MPKLEHIDNGQPFDWGQTSGDYGKYRDIYPASFFDSLRSLGVAGTKRVLDLGTGTGVLPRGLYDGETQFVGVDISPSQIEEAQRLAVRDEQDIRYVVGAAENIDLESSYFDFVIAAQCVVYFDLPRAMKEIDRVLNANGRFIVAWVTWLPKKSEITQRTIDLVLQYNPQWEGSGYERDFGASTVLEPYGFALETEIAYEEDIYFTVETWAGRTRACRGVGAALPTERVAEFDREHVAMLEASVSDRFPIPHHVHIRSFARKK